MSDYTRNIGSNKGAPRLWLEGKILLEHGFTHKTPWSITKQPDGSLEIIAMATEGQRVRLVAGTPQRPIIDINSSVLLADLGAGVSIEAHWDILFVSRL